MSACSCVWPAERLAQAVLPVGAARNDRPGVQAEAVGLDRLPHVDVRMPDDEHVRSARHLLGKSGLLRSGHEVVDEDAQPAAGFGFELIDDMRPGRRCRRGTRRRRPRPSGRHPRPSRRARRRGVPRHRCGSAARPGLGRRRPPGSPTRCAWASPSGVMGATRTTGRPSSRKPGPSGNTLRTSRRSSSSTVPRSRSTRMISPQKPVTASSTTSPRSATASSDRPRGGLRSSRRTRHRCHNGQPCSTPSSR